MLRLLAVLLVIGCVAANKLFLMAPSMLHVGVEEDVFLKVKSGGQDVNVQIYLQDFPARRNTFSRVQGVFSDDVFGSLKVKVDAANLPDVQSLDKQYVYLVAKSDDAHCQFHKEAKVLLSYRDGLILIQTDKPIYTPNQQVRIRVFPLGFDLKPTSNKVTLIVENPQGIRVQQWDDLDAQQGIISKTIPLSDFILNGNWTIRALYGHQDVYNASAQFEVREYVLPKFSVKLTVPPYVLETDKLINVVVSARYTYNKPVVGSLRVLMKVAGKNMDPILFSMNDLLLDDGEATITERTEVIVLHPSNIWFPEGGRLLVEATVIEKATGVKETAVDSSAVFTSTPYVIKVKDTPEYFKPGLPFVVKVEIKHPNQRPATGIPLAIVATGKDGNGNNVVLKQKDAGKGAKVQDRTDALGKATFTVDTTNDLVELNIKVETNNTDLTEEQNGEKEHSANAYSSPSNSFLMLRQLAAPAKVGQQFTCEAFLRSNDAKMLSYLIVAKGRIIQARSVQKNPGVLTTITILATADMSPSARLIGYYVLDSGEVVSDSILLDVEDTFPTSVEFVADNKEQRPSTNFIVTVEAPEGTRVGLLAVDQSVYLLNNKNRMTSDRVFEDIEKLDLGCGVGGGKDWDDVFLNAGVTVITESRSSSTRQSYGCPPDAPGNRKRRSLSKSLSECCQKAKEWSSRNCARRFESLSDTDSKECKQEFVRCCNETWGPTGMSILARNGLDGFEVSEEEIIEQLQVRTNFPESWMYTDIDAELDPDLGTGVARLGVTLPGTITTWVLQAVGVNSNTGFGMAKPFNLLATMDLFVSLKLPYSAQRGEQVSLVATVFNYAGVKVDKVTVHLEGSKDFCSAAPAKARTSIGTIRDLETNDAKSVSFPIVPTRLGKIAIKVYAVAVNMASGDIVKRELLVVPEGVTRRKTQSFVLDPQRTLVDANQNGGNRPTASVPTKFKSSRVSGNNKQFDTIKLALPANRVPNSEKAAAYITGNLMGPVVTNLIKGNLQSLLRMPTGCGEQTMIKLGPNVYVLQYLQNTNQVTDDIERNAFNFIQSGYQRELNYRRDDLSFSAWGNRRPGSTWLTAFVIKVFAQAKRLGGAINIDREVICSSAGWLVNNQRGDGAYPERHAVAHKEMNGGTYTEGDVAMTAFVLSSLLECNCPSVGIQGSIRRALTYLEAQLEGLNRPYSMALTAYALALADSPKKQRANERLTQIAIFDPASNTRHWNAGGTALNVETAGYVLLTQLALGRVTYAGPIVVWITEHRNTAGGFISTQDTCVALQALAKYSERARGGILDLRIKVTAENKNGWEKRFHIIRNNSLLQRKVDLTPIIRNGPGDLFIETSGSGVAQMQVEVRYNIPSARDESCEFDLNVTTRPVKTNKPQGDDGNAGKKKGKKGYCYQTYKKGSGCSKVVAGKKKRFGDCCKGNSDGGWAKSKKKADRKKCKRCSKEVQQHESVNAMFIDVCTRYKRAGQTAGMSIVEVGLFTGFEVDIPSLDQLEGSVPELDRHENSDRAVVFYLSKIPSDKNICLSFKVNRENDVGIVQPVPVNVYDYYEPGDCCTTFYGPEKNSALSMGVCSPKQCTCTQDECTLKDPPVKDIRKVQDMACNKYEFALKGEVVLTDELNNWLTFEVKVSDVFKQGNMKVKPGDFIEFKKRGTCLSPDLKKGTEYAFMGRDKGRQRVLDKSAWVKKWPKEGVTHKALTDIFGPSFQC